MGFVATRKGQARREEVTDPEASASALDRVRRELEEMGLSPYEARVVLALLRLGSASGAQLARVSGVPRTSVYSVLEDLVTKRLVERLPGEKAAVWASPGRDLVFDRLDAAQEERLRAHRARTARVRQILDEELPESGTVAAPHVHIVRGVVEVRAIYDRLLLSATEEVLVFNRPPYSIPASASPLPPGETPRREELVNPVVIETVARGVKIRALYQKAEWEGPEAASFRRFMDVYHQAGVEAGLVDELPIKLAVADRSLVLFALPEPRLEVGFPTNLFIEHAGFASLHARIFDDLWSVSTPLT